MKNPELKKLRIEIDGNEFRVPEGLTILQAASFAGIYIPRLCYVEGLEPYGGCRLCIVQVENMKGFPTACTTPVTEGMRITTKNSELQALRKEVLELILSEHPYTCLVCKEKNECQEFMHSTRKVSVTTGCNFCTSNGDCELQDLVEYLELDRVRFPVTYRSIPPEKDNPFYDLDYNLCILCGRCVRICNEERFSEVLAFIQRGNSALVGTAFGESQKEAGCEFCGACVDVCPTGSISEKMGAWAGKPERSEETTCPSCPVACTLNVNMKGNRVVNIGPPPGQRMAPAQLCIRGKFVPGDIVHHPERIKNPLVKKDGRWIETDWDNAYDFIAENLKKCSGQQFGIIGSAQDTVENNYVLQKFGRDVMKSGNADVFGSYPDRSILSMIHAHLMENKPASINEIPVADVVLVLGTQAYWTHPILENRIRKAYKSGKNVIQATTFENRTTLFSKETNKFNPGEEHVYLLLLLRRVAKSSEDKTAGSILAALKGFDEREALKKAGLNAGEIERTAESLLKAGKSIIIAGDGILRSQAGKRNLEILFWMHKILDKTSECHMIFPWNEGNLYGSTLAGMHPDYKVNFEPVDKKARGLTAEGMIDNTRENGIRSLFIVGDIPPHKNLERAEFIVQQNIFVTESSSFADILLPLNTFLESGGHMIDMEGKYREIKPVVKPYEDNPCTWEIIKRLAAMLNAEGFSFRSTNGIFREFSGHIKEKSKGYKLPEKPLAEMAAGKNGHPHFMILEPNQFHVFGNIISSYVPDMKKARDEGILFVSGEFAANMSLEESEIVNIITEYGKLEIPVSVSAELHGNITLFKPTWQHQFALSDNIQLHENYIPVTIEKMKDG